MGTGLLGFALVIASGAVIGLFARPRTWLAVYGLIAFATAFLGIALATAAWFGYTSTQIYQALLLAGVASDSEDVLAAVFVAYAALFGSAVFAFRVAREKRREAHEP